MKKQFPKSINDITVKDYMHINLLQQEYKNDEVKLNHEILKYFNGGEVLLKDFQTKLIELTNILNTPQELVQTIKINGKEFGLIPNFDELTVGEWIDIDTYQSDEQSIHKLLAIFYRPITKRYKHLYQIEVYEGSSKYSNVMLKQPISLYLGVVGFFLRLNEMLLNKINTYSMNQ